MEKKKIAVLIGSLQADAASLLVLLKLYVNCHQDFPGTKKVTLSKTWHLEPESHFSNLFIFIKLSLL